MLTSALSANIRLGWKGLPGTNTLADYELLFAKKFYNIDTGTDVIKLFTVIIYGYL